MSAIFGGLSVKRAINEAWVVGLTALALGASFARPAATAALLTHPIVIAVRHGACNSAVKLVNPRVNSNDDQTAFLAGRMLDEGICVHKDSDAATDFFARAADLGNHLAILDYATQIGLGEGAAQDYERAGHICHAAGLDPDGQVAPYSLGYACTVSGVAGRLLRIALPEGAFRSDTGAVLVEFTPAVAAMRIRGIPQVTPGAAPTGTNVRPLLVNAHQEIEKAWSKALAVVPKPDASRLGNEAVVLSIDVDMTLERGHVPEKTPIDGNGPLHMGSLQNGDLRPMGP
jgi:hypothetical protein